MQKCVFKGCSSVGRPSEGFEFFACERCQIELEALITLMYEQKQREARERAEMN